MEHLSRALEAFHRMGSRRMVISVIDIIASAAEQHGFDVEAARLLGTTESVRAEQKTLLSPRAQRDNARVVAALKRRMGEAAYQLEYTSGQRQWLNHAAQEALRLTRAIRNAPDGVVDEWSRPLHPAGRAVAKALDWKRDVKSWLVRGAADRRSPKSCRSPAHGNDARVEYLRNWE